VVFWNLTIVELNVIFQVCELLLLLLNGFRSQFDIDFLLAILTPTLLIFPIK
jgi:hypothetical protein